MSELPFVSDFPAPSRLPAFPEKLGAYNGALAMASPGTMAPEVWEDRRLHRYTARTKPKWVHDGDTFRVTLDLGFRIGFDFTVRLYGIDTPELPTPEGIAARDYLTYLIADLAEESPDGMARLAVRTIKEADGDDKTTFGRYLCEVGFAHERGVLVDLAACLIEAGHGVRRTR